MTSVPVSLTSLGSTMPLTSELMLGSSCSNFINHGIHATDCEIELARLPRSNSRHNFINHYAFMDTHPHHNHQHDRSSLLTSNQQLASLDMSAGGLNNNNLTSPNATSSSAASFQLHNHNNHTHHNHQHHHQHSHTLSHSHRSQASTAAGVGGADHSPPFSAAAAATATDVYGNQIAELYVVDNQHSSIL